VLGAHLLMEVSRSQRKVAASAAVEGRVYADAPAGSSPWQLYLEQLPRHYTNLCNWNLGDIESLQVTHAQEAAKSAVEEVEKQWRSVCPLLRDIGEEQWRSVCPLLRDIGEDLAAVARLAHLWAHSICHLFLGG